MEVVAYQVKVKLQEIKPVIWRRLVVPAGITFYKFHKVLQAAFGWQDYHLYSFEFEADTIMEPDPDFAPGEFSGRKEWNSKRTRIDDWLKVGVKFGYTYDFGDNWEHEIVVEKRLTGEERLPYAVCLDGARHRPPEDVGGVPGYEDFLAIIKNPRDDEYEEMLAWAEKDTDGRKFDPAYFYLPETYRLLARVKC